MNTVQSTTEYLTSCPYVRRQCIALDGPFDGLLVSPAYPIASSRASTSRAEPLRKVETMEGPLPPTRTGERGCVKRIHNIVVRADNYDCSCPNARPLQSSKCDPSKAHEDRRVSLWATAL